MEPNKKKKKLSKQFKEYINQDVLNLILGTTELITQKKEEIKKEPDYSNSILKILDQNKKDSEINKLKNILLPEEEPDTTFKFTYENPLFKEKKINFSYKKDLNEVVQGLDLTKLDLIQYPNIGYQTFDFDQKKIDYIQQHTNLEQLLQEIDQEHNHYLNFFNNKIEKVVLTPTEHTELSAEYAQRIKEMSKSITAEEIREVVSMLKVGPLINAVMELGQGLGDRQKQVSSQTRKNVQNLIGLYQRTIQDSEIAKLLNIPCSGTADIFDPTQDHLILNQMLVKGGACTANHGDKAPQAEAFAKDSLAGGSVHFQANGVKGSSYNRLYIAVDTEGNPILFYDCIESGDITRMNMTSYGGLQDVLLSSFASSIIIANRLGINKLSFGDVELVDIARNLGFGERRIFKQNQDNHQQKLGYIGGSNHFSMGNTVNGPYIWMMKKDKSFRTVNPQLYQAEALVPLVYQAYQVMNRIQQQPKSLKSMKKDYETFFGVFNEVIENTKNSLATEDYDKIRSDVSAFCEKYHLQPYQLTKVKPVEPEKAQPILAISGLAA